MLKRYNSVKCDNATVSIEKVSPMRRNENNRFSYPILSPILMLITKHIFCRYGGLIANLLQNNNPLPGKQADSTPVHPSVGIFFFKKMGLFFLQYKKKIAKK